jgi:hypothetical protein
LAVVIKGTTCAGARRLAVHLLRTDTNERAELAEVRGVVAEDLPGALREMEAVAAGTRSTKPFYHASINTRADEPLTDAQRAEAIDRLEAALGLSGQSRVVVIHKKEGREHCHIVWSRIDLERMAAISDSHNYRKHEEVARTLEREFGHARVQGAHIEREGKPRPERTPSHAEMLQADRTGLSPKDVRQQLTGIWRDTKDGQDFAGALWQSGYVLARGDRRDFVVIDPRGGTHSLSRRIEGATAKDIRERLADIEPSRLPNITDAKKIQRARQERNAARGKDRSDTGRETSPRAAPMEIPRDIPKAHVGRSRGSPEGPAGPGRAADAAGRAAFSLLDGLASIFERGLFGDESQSDQEKQAREQEPEPKSDQKETPHEASVRNDEEERAKRSQALLQEFGRDLDRDQEDDHDPERARGRGRGRRRSR